MISGFWLPQFPLPLIRVGVNLPSISDRRQLVVMVLDTGATRSAIHPLDAMHTFGMSAASLDSAVWRTTNSSGGVGGKANFMTVPAKYALYRDDGTTPEILGGTVELAEMTPQNQSLPSLLGWDVLQHFRIILEGQNSVRLQRL